MLSQEANVDELYDHLLTVVQNVDFLNMLGLGNEVPFFICPYRPEDETDINKITENLVKKLHEVGVHVLHINLYDLSIELMQKRGIWQRTLEKEPGIKKQKLQELLSNVLDAEKHLVPAIAEKMKTDSNFQVMFLSGVGQIYPFIRTHNILNNLQSHAEDKPTVIFFPGKYKHSLEKGAALQLFSLLHDDKYYRAFNILEYSV